MKLGRNDPCHCGSGQKYKKCHQAEDDAKASAELKAKAAERAAAAAEAAAKAEEEGAGEGKEAASANAADKPLRSKAQIPQQRPKAPQAHNANLPRRGAV